MSQEPKIYVAGHRGMVVSAIVRHLQNSVIAPGPVIASEARQSTPQIITRTHAELDLTNQAAVQVFVAKSPKAGSVNYPVA